MKELYEGWIDDSIMPRQLLSMMHTLRCLSLTAKSCLEEEARSDPNALVDEMDVANVLSSNRLMKVSEERWKAEHLGRLLTTLLISNCWLSL
jgi:hypothetical protein